MVSETDAEQKEQTPATLRDRIVQAAADLLEREGLEALSTRAVAARADVPPPTIFRLFGDKDGLLEAVGNTASRPTCSSKASCPSLETLSKISAPLGTCTVASV